MSGGGGGCQQVQQVFGGWGWGGKTKQNKDSEKLQMHPPSSLYIPCARIKLVLHGFNAGELVI